MLYKGEFVVFRRRAKLRLCYLNAATSSNLFGAVLTEPYENNTRSKFLAYQSYALLAKRALRSFASHRHTLLLHLRKPLQQSFVPFGQM